MHLAVSRPWKMQNSVWSGAERAQFSAVAFRRPWEMPLGLVGAPGTEFCPETHPTTQPTVLEPAGPWPRMPRTPGSHTPHSDRPNLTCKDMRNRTRNHPEPDLACPKPCFGFSPKALSVSVGEKVTVRHIGRGKRLDFRGPFLS